MFKICIVFKISIRRDGGSPCRKRKKEESPAATGSFSGFARGEIARTRLMHRHSISFRRAPDRKVFKEKKNNHLDPYSYLVVVRSKDGEHWTKEPELLYAHPFGGSQDPCLLKLKDGTLLCASYLWTFIRPDGLAVLKKPFVQNTDAVFAGGYGVGHGQGF